MKTLLKTLLLILFVLFICGKFFDYLDKRREKQKDPFIHVGCKLAHYGKMGGEPCEICLSRYNAENQRRYSIILKKWKNTRGKAFDPTDDSQLKEMLQIMDNYKIGQYL